MIASRARLVLLVWLLAVAAILLASWVALADPRNSAEWEEVVLVPGLGFGFMTVGAILVARRPREPVGRISLLIGLVAVIATALRSVAIALDQLPGPIPDAGAAAAAVSAQLSNTVVLAGGLLLVRFPSGREHDRLSALADSLFVLSLACTTVVIVAPGLLESTAIAPTRNPLGVDGLSRGTAAAIANAGLFAYIVGLGVTVAVLVRRYRRSGPVIRAQIRWVAAAGAVPLVVFPGLFLGPAWLWSLWFLSFALLPWAIGIAILRYRLYDIDRIISRTLAYAVVTALLAAVFMGVNLVLQSAVVGVTGGGDTMAIAVSTLLVAALFQPIRRHVQAPIDRRFNRAHQDAERVVGSFAHRTRDEVDLARLRGTVVGVVVEAVGPAGASIWLRADRHAPGPVADAVVVAP